LRETTAAAIILLSMWRRKHPLLDPFCGSGTIAIEAALFAWNAAPGLGRNFALSVLPFSDPVVEKNTREELRAKVDFTHEFCIDGSDGDAHTVALARANSKRAYELAAGHTAQGDPRCLPRFTVARLQDLRPDPARSGYVLTNPPYGKRLGDRAGAEALYGELGRFCAEHLKNWQTCIISDHAGFESFFGKKASSCREITNGANPAYFFIFPPPCVPA
jgi:putative N6-adenine-specific DNA methylase